ncbi:endonuclease/exonuclease/phosphatase family protein [uncultured Brevibacterium sp.]|uniref:endonuclease/exonuclease/phosphatase family protein n=1 Tax=uncultured Brevibacterium sp. TaxID=189678 RepID=UPI0025E0D42C|nr:endonuclease/exonuclease/phosphatase family protein [uncultured Brevibacterium sp.]
MLDALRRPSVIFGAGFGVLISLLCFFPEVFSLHTVTGFVHFTAMRPFALAVVGGATLLGFLLWAFWRSPMLLAMLVVVALFTGIVGVQWASKGLRNTAEVAAPSGDKLTVVSANVLIGNDSYDRLFKRISDTDADIVALQEAAHTTVEDKLEKFGLSDAYLVTPETPTASPTDADSLVMVKHDLEPEVIDAHSLPFATAGVRTSLGEFYSIHAHAPVQSAVEQRNWAHSVKTERDICERATLIAGDFNATTDSPLMRTGRCSDSAEELNMGARGSWPSKWSSMLGARIDHHLYNPEVLTPYKGEMFVIDGSDHRGLEFSYAFQDADGSAQDQ